MVTRNNYLAEIVKCNPLIVESIVGTMHVHIKWNEMKCTVSLQFDNKWLFIP
jgi:hypothetical protein